MVPSIFPPLSSSPLLLTFIFICRFEFCFCLFLKRAKFLIKERLKFSGGRYKSWKRRWFILNDNCLYYFEYTTDKEPRGIIPLENIQVREASDRHKPHCFELYATGTDFIKACKTDSEGKVVEGKQRFIIRSPWNNILLLSNIIIIIIRIQINLFNVFLPKENTRFIECRRRRRTKKKIG